MSNNQTNNTTISSTAILNNVTAGYVAGFFGTIVGHPLDSIKVLMQTNNYHSASSSGGAASANTVVSASASSTAASNAATTNALTRNMSTVTEIANSSASSKRSLRALYAGITGPVLTVGGINAFVFSLYDTSRRIFHQVSVHNGNATNKENYLHQDSLFNVFLAATTAGSIVSLLTSPFQVIKTKQQIMVWSFRKAIRDTSSIKSLFVGFRPHLFCEGLGRGVYFTTYEVLKRSIIARKQESASVDGTVSITLPERAFCAALSGASCWAFIFPADVLRCRLYARSIVSPSQQTGAWEMTKSIYKQGGNSIKPFFRGFWVTVARAGPVAATVLPIYDLILERMQKAQHF